MLEPIWNPFSKYADKQEKRIEKFLRRLSYLGKFEVEAQVKKLMQQNLVIFNLYLEYKFKGYKYLRKGARKKMYRNAEKIAYLFDHFTEKNVVRKEDVLGRLKRQGVKVGVLSRDDMRKLAIMVAIMEFLRPGRRYEYLEGASFGKLLVDPEAEKMIGDCNQIVTFYVFLYAKAFDLSDLKIKLPTGHVCLHFKGIDIEATSGNFTYYKDYEAVLPISELISTNLLDISDMRDKVAKIEAMEFVKGAKLASALSSDQELVRKNLKVAYHNIAVEAMKKKQFKTAEFYFGQTGDRKNLEHVYHNACLYFLKKNLFSKAEMYAEKGSDGELKKHVKEKEAYYYLTRGKTGKARRIYQGLGNREMVKATYAREYNALQKKVAGLKDLGKMRLNKGTYRKMLELAKKMEDYDLAERLRKLLKEI